MGSAEVPKARLFSLCTDQATARTLYQNAQRVDAGVQVLRGDTVNLSAGTILFLGGTFYRLDRDTEAEVVNVATYDQKEVQLPSGDFFYVAVGDIKAFDADQTLDALRDGFADQAAGN